MSYAPDTALIDDNNGHKRDLAIQGNLDVSTWEDAIDSGNAYEVSAATSASISARMLWFEA